MRAAVFREHGGPIAVEVVPDPECPTDGVVVEVRACGVCRSDHHAWMGADPDVTPPHVPGHEMAGVIVEASSTSGWTVGERVTAPFILGCGQCVDCRGGEPTLCAHQHVMGFSGPGAFAEYVAVPHASFNLVRLPDAIGFSAAAAMGCRVTTAYRALVERGRLAPGEWLCVHGCGGVGLSAVMIARAIGARVVAVDVNAAALALAERFGAAATLDAAALADGLTGAVHDATDGGAHVSVDALGHGSTFANSLRSLRRGGRHVQIGMPVGPHARPILPLLDIVYARQITIHGTRGMGAAGFGALFDMVLDGRIDLDALVRERIALDGVGDALASLDGPGAGVTVVDSFGAVGD